MSDQATLFDLVSLLTQSEKRYFVRFATLYSSRRDNVYLRLFNRLAGMKRYRPELIRSEFGTKHYEQLKRQLFNKILDALRLYHERKSDSSRAWVSFRNGELLRSKGIERMGKREAARAESTAAGCGSQSMELHFLEKRIGASVVSAQPAELEELSEMHSARSVQLLKQIQEIGRYTDLLIKVEILNRRFEGTRSEADLVLIERFLNNKLLATAVVTETPRAAMLRCFCRGLANYLRCEFAQAAVEMEQAWQYVRRFPFLGEQDPVTAIRVAANRTLSYYHSGNRSHYLRSMEDLTALNTEESSLRHYQEEIILILELMDLNGREQHQQAVKKIRLVRAVNDNTEQPQLTQTGIYRVYQEVIALHGSGEPGKASAAISRFIGMHRKRMKEDAYVTARIVFLLLRFEMEDETLTVSELRSVPAALLKRQKFYQVERAIVKFVSRMMTLSTVIQRRKSTRELIGQLSSLRQVPFERNAFMYFDFLKWAERYAAKL